MHASLRMRDFAQMSRSSRLTQTLLTSDPGCVAALGIPNSQIYLFVPQFTSGGNCYIVATDTCGGQAANQYLATLGNDGFGQITIGNLNCGETNGVE